VKKRQFQPGDLYLLTAQSVQNNTELQRLSVGAEVTFFDLKLNLKLVCRHSCGAMEFLVISKWEPT
jgi:hypothetical protein